jgi:hypothetical protein
MVVVNREVKEAINEAKKVSIKQWMIAEKYGLHEGNFSRLLRHELPADEKQRIIDIIEELKSQKGA